MHLHFVYPRWTKLLEAQPSLLERLSAHEVGCLRMTSLGIPTAVGALPEGVRVTFCDDHVNDACAPLPQRPDALCLGYFTPQATRAHAIADHWRGQGIPVICGGIHPSALPEDAGQHADAVVCGPVESLWEEILSDLAAGSLRSRYEGKPWAPFAPPRRELFATTPSLRIDVVQSARGCDQHCAFCVVPRVNGHCIQRKPVAEVIEDCARTKHGAVFLADENLLHADPPDTEWAAAFHEGLRQRRLRKWFTAAIYPRTLISFAANHSRAREWAAVGLRQLYLICGYMGPLQRELNNPALRSAMDTLRSLGIEVLATFTLGNDGDAAGVDDLVLDFWQASGANLAEVTISVPFPGTRRFEQLQSEGRLLHQDWQRYNGAWCVFTPRQGSAQEVEACSLRLWQALYADRDRGQVQASYVRGFGGDILRDE